MPRYDYRCVECNAMQEVTHGINDLPSVLCPSCRKPMRKLISRCTFSIHNTTANIRAGDNARREQDMRAEIREGFGIEKIRPLSGSTTADIYRDIKAAPGLVRERMAAEKEKNEKKTKAKQRDWAIKANRRVAERTRIANEKKAEEAAAKRTIIL